MATEDKKSSLAQIASLKKELMLMRVKASAGETIVINDYRKKRKEVAKLFTQINKKKVEA